MGRGSGIDPSRVILGNRADTWDRNCDHQWLLHRHSPPHLSLRTHPGPCKTPISTQRLQKSMQRYDNKICVWTSFYMLYVFLFIYKQWLKMKKKKNENEYIVFLSSSFFFSRIHIGFIFVLSSSTYFSSLIYAWAILVFTKCVTQTKYATFKYSRAK